MKSEEVTVGPFVCVFMKDYNFPFSVSSPAVSGEFTVPNFIVKLLTHKDYQIVLLSCMLHVCSPSC